MTGRDVAVPDGAIAWLCGRGPHGGMWAFEPSEVVDELAAGGVAMSVDRGAAATDDGYLRGVDAPAQLADVLDLASTVHGLREQLHELKTAAAISWLTVEEQGAQSRKLSEVAKCLAVLGHGLMQNAATLDPEVAVGVAAFLRGDDDDGAEAVAS